MKSFIAAWLDKSIENVQNRDWLSADPKDPSRGKCKVCQDTNGRLGKTFSIKEGYTAITSHAKGKSHIEVLKKSKTEIVGTDTNMNRGPEQITVEESFDNARMKNEAAKVVEAQLLEAQTIWSYSVHHHGLPSDFFKCSSDLFPRMFPDSEIAKLWAKKGKYGMGKTKGDYFGTHGLHPFLTDELITDIKASPGYSINFDESDELKRSQLNINISFIKEDKVIKSHLTTVSMEEGTSAEEIKDAVSHVLESSFISLEKLVNITTDGCSTMLGATNGVHALFRELVPTLPNWGGCLSHDSSHLLQYGVPKLHPSFLSVSKSFHSYINGVSLHRKREYEDLCQKLGFKPSQAPKHFDIRFRTVNLEAHWLEKDDRSLFLFISALAEQVKSGAKKDLTEAEMVLLEEYLGNYVEFRLTTKFLCDTSDFILKFLNTFEKRESQVHRRHQLIVEFVYSLLSKLLKNAGLGDEDIVTADTILNVNFKEEKLHKSFKEIYIGPKAEEFLVKLGLSKTSPELASWMSRVKEFFVEVIEKAFKYLSPSLKSLTLQYLSIISPKFNIITPLDDLKKRYLYIGKKFSNIISPVELPELLDQVTLMKAQQSFSEVADQTPEQFFGILHNSKDSKYNLVSRLGQSMLTIYNSSSEAERDFSIQHGLVGDPLKNKTSQLRLQMRMRIKTNTFLLKQKCEQCIDVKKEESDDEDDEEEASCRCHCTMFKPSESLLASMSGGQPSRRYKAEEKEKRKVKADVEATGVNNYRELGGQEKEKKDLKEMLEKWRRKLRKQTEREARKSKEMAEKQKVSQYSPFVYLPFKRLKSETCIKG